MNKKDAMLRVKPGQKISTYGQRNGSIRVSDTTTKITIETITVEETFITTRVRKQDFFSKHVHTIFATNRFLTTEQIEEFIHIQIRKSNFKFIYQFVNSSPDRVPVQSFTINFDNDTTNTPDSLFRTKNVADLNTSSTDDTLNLDTDSVFEVSPPDSSQSNTSNTYFIYSHFTRDHLQDGRIVNISIVDVADTSAPDVDTVSSSVLDEFGLSISFDLIDSDSSGSQMHSAVFNFNPILNNEYTEEDINAFLLALENFDFTKNLDFNIDNNIEFGDSFVNDLISANKTDIILPNHTDKFVKNSRNIGSEQKRSTSDKKKRIVKKFTYCFTSLVIPEDGVFRNVEFIEPGSDTSFFFFARTQDGFGNTATFTISPTPISESGSSSQLTGYVIPTYIPVITAEESIGGQDVPIEGSSIVILNTVIGHINEVGKWIPTVGKGFIGTIPEPINDNNNIDNILTDSEDIWLTNKSASSVSFIIDLGKNWNLKMIKIINQSNKLYMPTRMKFYVSNNHDMQDEQQIFQIDEDEPRNRFIEFLIVSDDYIQIDSRYIRVELINDSTNIIGLKYIQFGGKYIKEFDYDLPSVDFTYNSSTSKSLNVDMTITGISSSFDWYCLAFENDVIYDDYNSSIDHSILPEHVNTIRGYVLNNKIQGQYDVNINPILSDISIPNVQNNIHIEQYFSIEDEELKTMDSDRNYNIYLYIEDKSRNIDSNKIPNIILKKLSDSNIKTKKAVINSISTDNIEDLHEKSLKLNVTMKNYDQNFTYYVFCSDKQITDLSDIVNLINHTNFDNDNIRYTGTHEVNNDFTQSFNFGESSNVKAFAFESSDFPVIDILPTQSYYVYSVVKDELVPAPNFIISEFEVESDRDFTKPVIQPSPLINTSNKHIHINVEIYDEVTYITDVYISVFDKPDNTLPSDEILVNAIKNKYLVHENINSDSYTGIHDFIESYVSIQNETDSTKNNLTSNKEYIVCIYTVDKVGLSTIKTFTGITTGPDTSISSITVNPQTASNNFTVNFDILNTYITNICYTFIMMIKFVYSILEAIVFTTINSV